MATTHKISEDFFEDSFLLIALHSNLEDYAIGYSFNLHLKSNFKRAKTDLDVNQHISFPFFEWDDIKNDIRWTLISNHSKLEELEKQDGLFSNESSYTTHYLIPEHKEVDYFLKIEQEDEKELESILKQIVNMPNVVTAYSIDVENLKSKNNLIF
ncbi:IPExxxVDY family protein [Cellulophaga sp. F20128]|uniref:IPExxxVDY family protein n=1 Tax=Cellulophaga sp. F20128 TaxID=2926413 RepID=UPI001FF34A6A|nr:IPExxxVDY family protein [Cellulophaga sp. F20128]MCK0158581.1 IPExxxVDY family protein [Cellulophaga sp. F20128]